MGFALEKDFEDALVELLTSSKGWSKDILNRPTEEDLINNWADILFQNNRGKDQLNDVPLTKTEMDQIIRQVENLNTPLKLNGFINGASVTIIRDNPLDRLNYGSPVSLKIYRRDEIAGGDSCYQIARQPIFNTHGILSDRRGDIMLLINGMPVIHVELKRSGVPVMEAANQIIRYSKEGVFTGLFSMVQVFVAMNPEETIYFANPGPNAEFNDKFFFHWADFNNERVDKWDDIAEKLLSIPMAHKLIGFYTVADKADNCLKVMRSYQYFAAEKVSDQVGKLKDQDGLKLAGFIYACTGSGKTMSSFKSAQLIASSGNADKVVFLVDRIELGTQSLDAYQSYANDDESVQSTSSTDILVERLKSNNSSDQLIVTSIQKMSKITPDNTNGSDYKKILGKKIVILIDECHRDTHGDMLINIKKTFPHAMYFGFTGTPIFEGDEIRGNTTADVFGDELHRYTIADGIRDGNVLRLDPNYVSTYDETDMRQAVGFEQAKAEGLTDADKLADVLSNPAKAEVYNAFMDKSVVPMVGYMESDGNYVKGIEDYMGNAQYMRNEHIDLVVDDIIKKNKVYSKNGQFHGIFATSSIAEAINYYRKFKAKCPEFRVTCVFDPSIDNSGSSSYDKEKGMEEILLDYSVRYGVKFDMASYAKFKTDVAYRLGHKYQYKFLSPDKVLDMVIVVEQMLTGYDSQYINVLYMDKTMSSYNLIQAISRTNRIYGFGKPFGNVVFYRKPNTMKRNLEYAFRKYSGIDPYKVYVQKLYYNVKYMNASFDVIKDIFEADGIQDFARLPVEKASRAKFAKEFNKLNKYLEAARVQGFDWDRKEYEKDGEKVILAFTKVQYETLLQRYRELGKSGGGVAVDIPYEIDGNIMSIQSEVIDTNYLNSRFKKYIKELERGDLSEADRKKLRDEIHRTFAVLSDEEQRYAEAFLLDIESGDIVLDLGKTCRDYINEYRFKAKSKQVQDFSAALGLDADKLQKMMNAGVTEDNINAYSRFDELKNTVDKIKAKTFIKEKFGKDLSGLMLSIEIHNLLKEFILSGGFDI